jgi:hypothetical protein
MTEKKLQKIPMSGPKLASPIESWASPMTKPQLVERAAPRFEDLGEGPVFEEAGGGHREDADHAAACSGLPVGDKVIPRLTAPLYPENP